MRGLTLKGREFIPKLIPAPRFVFHFIETGALTGCEAAGLSVKTHIQKYKDRAIKTEPFNFRSQKIISRMQLQLKRTVITIFDILYQ
ncbi:hypothetical protein EO92_04975 [Methanosarcina sp. 2.H.A.1B.4]|nr:hypothetical protein EO92_04975 [Methanosarcina sp. 2.H.A.1B.4]